MGHIATIGELSRRAATLAEAGRHEEAISAWAEAQQHAPANPAVAAGLGAALLAATWHHEALDWLTGAAARHPDDLLLGRLHAQALGKLGHRRAAIGALFVLLAQDPDDIELQGDLALALFAELDCAAALPFAERAFAAAPTAVNCATLANVLFELGRIEDALEVAASAVARGVPPASLFTLKSMLLQKLARHAEALDAARAAVALDPAHAIARHQLAATLLMQSQMTPEAWALYESRVGLPGMRDWPQPERRWTGQDVAGKTVLLHAEQGLGDTLQFVRYVPLVAARGARVVLVVQRPLLRLLRHTPGAARIVPAGEPFPAFDLYCPLMSLPGCLGTTIDTIPPPIPYPGFRPSPSPRARRRVGLVWAGNGGFVHDRARSLDPQALAILAGVPGVAFHGLQLGATSMPLPGMTDALHGVQDLADTAARLQDIDLVIAVDTSVAHLAATLGLPVWLLSRFDGCWRWLLEREDTPWYPSMRIFRQTRLNDWAPVLDRVRGELVRWAADDLACVQEK